MVLSSICCLSFHGRLNQFDLSFLPVFMSKRISRQEGWVLANKMWFSGSLLILFCYPHHKNTDHGYCSLHQILCIFLLCTAAAIFGLILGQVSQPLGPLFPSPLPPQPKKLQPLTFVYKLSAQFGFFHCLFIFDQNPPQTKQSWCVNLLAVQSEANNLLAVPSETIKYDPRLLVKVLSLCHSRAGKGSGCMPPKRFCSSVLGKVIFSEQFQEIFAVANMRDREMEDHMESVVAFLQENKCADLIS